MSDQHKINNLQEIIATARQMVAFTGAGISAESGIPTYRGDDGLWNKYDPDKFANIQHFHKDPAYYWKFFREVRYPVIKKAQPNKAHAALARMEHAGKLTTLITQNIDGLHLQAGSRNVLELHGNTRRILCLSCGAQYAMDDVYAMLADKLPPDCPGCGGILKPDVVFFGESLSMEVLTGAMQASKGCDLFLVIGSSLVVQPAASLPVTAKESGAKLVIINKDPTPLDSLADLVLNTTASAALAPQTD